VTSCTKFETLKFQILKWSEHPPCKQGTEMGNVGKRSRSRRDRKVQSDLNSLVKISAGLQVP